MCVRCNRDEWRLSNSNKWVVLLKNCSMNSGEFFCTPIVGCKFENNACVDDDGSSGGGGSGGGGSGGGSGGSGGDSSGGSGGDNSGSGDGSGSGGSGDNSTTGGNSSTNDTNKPSGDQGNSSSSPLAILFIFALIASVIACVTAAAVILKRKAARARNDEELVSTVAE